jgi:hypothetical protein
MSSDFKWTLGLLTVGIAMALYSLDVAGAW